MTTQDNETPSGAIKELDGGNGEMFDQIAGRYDLLNRIMSMGQDQYWRRRAVKALELRDGDTILDVATGTGDLAIMIASKNPGVNVRGVDPSKNMIGVGNVKVAQRALQKRVELEIGDGLALPYEDDRFDGAVVAFGIRNFPDRLQGLREMRRVTGPGRKVVILELGEPERGLMSLAAKTYIPHVVPAVGAALSGKQEYKYLQESIAAFPPPAQFEELMREAGLKNVSSTPLSFGAVNLFVGTV